MYRKWVYQSVLSVFDLQYCLYVQTGPPGTVGYDRDPTLSYRACITLQSGTHDYIAEVMSI